MKREYTITFRVSQQEEEQILALAKQKHLAKGTYCRQIALEGK